MPSNVSWSLRGAEGSDGYEILFPDEATTFQVYDEDNDTYRILVAHCDPDDKRTRIFQFENTDGLDLEHDGAAVHDYCDDGSLLKELLHTAGCRIETHVEPDIPLFIFIGHEAAFSDS